MQLFGKCLYLRFSVDKNWIDISHCGVNSELTLFNMEVWFSNCKISKLWGSNIFICTIYGTIVNMHLWCNNAHQFFQLSCSYKANVHTVLKAKFKLSYVTLIKANFKKEASHNFDFVWRSFNWGINNSWRQFGRLVKYPKGTSQLWSI